MVRGRDQKYHWRRMLFRGPIPIFLQVARARIPSNNTRVARQSVASAPPPEPCRPRPGPMADEPSPSAAHVLGMMHDGSGGEAGDDDQQAREHTPRLLRPGVQSSAIRDRGLRSRSGFGSIDPFSPPARAASSTARAPTRPPTREPVGRAPFPRAPARRSGGEARGAGAAKV